MNPPANANGTEPMISNPARRRLGEPRRQWTEAPTDLLMLAATRSLATAAVGLTPRRINAGVISAPPPMPVRPTTMPTPKATTSTERAEVVRRSFTLGPPHGVSTDRSLCSLLDHQTAGPGAGPRDSPR